MENVQNIIEYYDELYPVKDDQKKFYQELLKDYSMPTKLLSVDCATGYFEHQLAREGHDVTGIETNRDLLKTANLRRRNQLMAVRFFEMSSLDMTRFLGKGFYNVISCLESRIAFIHDKTLIRKFFHDCKILLAEGGVLVLKLKNFDKCADQSVVKFPNRESVRAKLFTELHTEASGKKLLKQSIETGNGKLLPIYQNEEIYPLSKSEILEFSKEAGFTNATFYADWNKTPFTGSESEMLVILK